MYALFFENCKNGKKKLEKDELDLRILNMALE